MKNLLLLLLAFGFLGISNAQDLNVMSFNIRYNNSGDSLNAWPYRKDFVASEILFHDVDYLGVQEALQSQMQDLQDRLPGYKYIGGGRDDGKTKGEYSAIFYNTKRLKPLESGMFWLSQTPDVVGSKGWDANLPRIVTWAKFKDLKTGKTFFTFNTHFDHQGQEARRQSALLLLKKVKELAGNAASVITGDFNASPDSEPMQLITNKNNPLMLTDAKSISIQPHYGPTGTFNGFKNKELTDYPIDYIFLKGSWKVKKHATLSPTRGGRFASDHFALFSKLLLL
ncbi:MAG: endonuclease/exonuclease/phosphatase family protein [Niabella sp.]